MARYRHQRKIVAADAKIARARAELDRNLALLKATGWMTVDEYSIDDALSDGDFWPVPYIDCKRPYGERTYFQIDMAELLGEPYQFDAERNLVDDAEKDARLERLHYETLAALQVFLMHAELTTPA